MEVKKLVGFLVAISLVFSICIVVKAEGLGSWTTKASMPTARGYLGVVAVNEKIYAIGGGTGGEGITAAVEEYNPATDTWTTKASMPTARNTLAVVALNGKIYALGGYAGGTIGLSKKVEEYDPTTNTWTTKTDMLTERKQFAAAVSNGKIYVFGGMSNSGSFLNNVEEYDPITDTWTTKAAMPTGTQDLVAVAVNGKIYTIGGKDATGKEVHEYNPTTNTWIAKADMPAGKCFMGAVEYQGKIYIVGGADQYFMSTLNTVEEYNPSTDQWTSLSNMPAIRACLGAAVVNNKIYAIGGYNSSSMLSRTEEYAIPITTPTAPTNLTATAGNAQVNISWTTVSGATSYNVKRATTAGGPYTTVATGVSTNSYTDTTVTNGTTYYYVVTAVSANGESANSNEASATPVSGVPSNVAATVGSGQVEVTWTAVAGASGYNVKRSTTSGGPYTVVASNISTNAYTDTTTANGTTYYYVVSAISGEVESANSAQVTAAPIGTPSNLTAVESNSQVSLTWKAAAGAKKYNVKRADVAGGPYTTIASNITKTSYIDTTAVNGNTYYYVVTAVNGSTESANSNEVAATPFDIKGSRAILTLMMTNGSIKEYDMSSAEIEAFVNWYDAKVTGTVGTKSYFVIKKNYNIKPFLNRKEYIYFYKIYSFEVSDYDE